MEKVCINLLFLVLVTFSVMTCLMMVYNNIPFWNRKLKQKENIAKSNKTGRCAFPGNTYNLKKITTTTEQFNHTALPNIRMKSNIRIYRRNLTHWLYDDKICENLPIFRKSVLRTSAGNTLIFVHNPKDDVHVSGSIIRSGRWEPHNANFICKLLRRDPDILFIDIGANIGVFSLTAAKCGKRVLSVEPLYINTQRLCASIISGKLLDRITILFAALSDVRENVTLGKARRNIGGTFVVKNKNPNKNNKKVGNQYKGQIMTAKLDDLLDLPRINFSKVFLKIDVEGFESKVLNGGKKFFDQVKIQGVLMEWLFHKTGSSGKEIIKYFAKRNLFPHKLNMRAKLSPNRLKILPVDVLWKHDNITL